jgi:hypothetical protein
MNEKSDAQEVFINSPGNSPVERELGRLALEHIHVMAENREYIVLRARADQIPNTIYEIGRLRAIALSEKGERRVKEHDLDHFDLYYLHLVVWNKKRREIAGGCRIGQVDIILKRFGHSGLYTGSMFTYSPLFLPEIGPALEIDKVYARAGRGQAVSVISALWKGLGYFISYNPHYRVLISAVSLSGAFSPLSRGLIVSFLKKNNYASREARLVEPLTPVGGNNSTNGFAAPKTHLRDINLLSRLVEDIEADGKGIPRALEHYVSLGGKLIGVKNDHSSRKKLTLLVLLDLSKCSRSALNHCMGKSGKERYFDYHGGSKDRAA